MPNHNANINETLPLPNDISNLFGTSNRIFISLAWWSPCNKLFMKFAIFETEIRSAGKPSWWSESDVVSVTPQRGLNADPSFRKALGCSRRAGLHPQSTQYYACEMWCDVICMWRARLEHHCCDNTSRQLLLLTGDPVTFMRVCFGYKTTERPPENFVMDCVLVRCCNRLPDLFTYFLGSCI